MIPAKYKSRSEKITGSVFYLTMMIIKLLGLLYESSFSKKIRSHLGWLFSSKMLANNRMRQLLIFCFFISGACGLVYEVAWLRTLGLIFGNTTFATSTVLAGYMAGLGLGALWWGKRIDTHGNPVKIYAKLEAGIGLYALATPFIWKLIDFSTIGFYRFIAPSFPIALIFKFIIAFSALLLPTFLMGATLPVLSKYFVKKDEEVGKQVGLLYGLNTLGAVCGVLFSGFIALQAFGVWQTVYLTGFLNLIIFFLCFHFTENQTAPCSPPLPPTGSSEITPSAPSTFSPNAIRILLVFFALSGAASMMYEIAWTRVLAISVGSSVYAFSIMLATFLLGISLGSYLLSQIPKSFSIDLHTFAAFQGLTAITAFLGMNVFNDMPYYFVRIFALSRGSDFMLHLGQFLLCSMVMLPPTLAIGAMFSCFIHVLRRSQSLGKEIGEAYFANTIGTILGSILTGFFMIPLIGIQNTLLLAASLNAIIGFFVFFIEPKPFFWKHYGALGLSFLLVLASACHVKSWDQGLITSDIAVKPQQAIGLNKQQLLRIVQGRDILFYKEGLSSTVTVAKLLDTLALTINGKVDASNLDNFTQLLLGHLPMTLHPQPQKVLIIGLGSGSTAGAVASYPIRQLDLVELEKAVVDAADYFRVLNRDVLKDPRVRMHVNDGRNFALLSPEQYDVIISEPSNPWMAGVANLFSLEHYKTLQKRLAPGGIVCQWFHAYSMSPEDLRMIMRTFSEVFPDASLWASYYPDLMLIGKNEPLELDFKTAETAFKHSSAAEDLLPYGIENPLGMFSNALLFNDGVRQFSKTGRIHSDNHPYLEFSAPRNLYKDTVSENLALLNMQRTFSIPPKIKNLEPPQDQNIAFHAALARGYLAKHFVFDAETLLTKAYAMDPENQEILLLMGTLYADKKDKEKSKAILTQVLEKNQAADAAHYRLGLFSLEEGQVLKAIDSFEKAIAANPKNAAYFIALGDTLVKINQDERAILNYEKALALKSEDFQTRFKKIQAIMRIRSFEEKKIATLDFIQRYPRYAEGYQWLGDLLENNGQDQEALGVYQEMAAVFPTESLAYIGLARNSDKLGRSEDVKKYLALAIRYNPALKQQPTVQKILRSRS